MYATFGQDGKANGFYDTNFNVIPVGAIEVPDALYVQWMQHTSGYLELVNGVVTHTIPPPPQLPINAVPSVISMRQARLALLQSGLLGEVEAIIAAMPQDAQIEWEFAATVERSHPLVTVLATELPLTEGELNDLFELGGSL